MTSVNVNNTVYAALFASTLQPSDAPTAEAVASAIGSTIRRLGGARCTGYVAEEFGNNPQEAANRMRWVRRIAEDLRGCAFLPTIAPSTVATASTDMLPLREAA